VTGFLPPPVRLGAWVIYLAAIVLVVAGTAVMSGTAPARAVRGTGANPRLGRLSLPWFLVASVALYWLLRARTHFLGDGAIWLSGLQRGRQLEGHEPLAEALWLATANALRAAGLEVTAGTVAPFSVLCGLIASVLIWAIARELARDGRQFVPVLLLLGTLGSAQLFFGYIESYPPVAVAILAFTYAGLRAARTGSAPWAAALLLATGVACHLACIYLLPAYVYLVARTKRKAWMTVLHVMLPLVLSTLFLLALGFGPDRWLETLRVATRALDPVGAGSVAPRDVRPYPVVSWDHALDLANEILLVLPAPLLLFLGRMVTSPRALVNRTDAPGTFLMLCAASGIAAACGLVLPVAPAQDWDLFSLLFIPAAALGIRAGLPILSGRGGSLISAGLVGVSLTSLGSFVGVNMDPAAGCRRYETLIGPGAKITPFARTYAHELLASFHRSAGEYDRALRHATALLRSEPTNPRLWALAGTIHYVSGEHAKAIPYLEQAIARGTKDPGAWTNLGICYSQVGRREEALEQFQIAMAREPDRPDHRVNLALGLINVGRADSARAILIETIRRWPTYDPARSALGRHFRGGP
jgi:hypothetical protein